MFSQYPLSSFFNIPDYIDPEKDLFNVHFFNRLMPFVKMLKWYFRPTFHGMENIPKDGAALLVGNHGLIGFDAFLIFAAIYESTGRLPRGLGDYHIFMDPISRAFWTKLGAIPGTPTNAENFLHAGHLVNVYPGGVRDAWKDKDQLYKLQWAKSKGFIRIAMKSQVPIILHMGIGTDETYSIIGKTSLFGQLLGHPKYELPILFGLGPLPKPVKFTYYISKPISLKGGVNDVNNIDLIDENHKYVWEIGEKMLSDGLKNRKSVWFG
ncbi:MAG: acyltransferase family protein [Desulfobacterales bacterium]|nr:acyltransferase family protein [Desulfobacterales bacterium]